jgi:tripartite-type tricarboxylate transporter receptor subunit TctC
MKIHSALATTAITCKRALRLATVIAASVPCLGYAQDYPTKPIILKVAYAVGGPADAAARQLQGPLQAALGQPVIVENVPGASGTLGTMAALRAPADGYTVLVATGSDAILGPLALASVKYKADELRLVHPLIVSEFVLVSSTKHSFAGLDDVVAKAKAPGQPPFSFGTWGPGSVPQLILADLKAQTGIQAVEVPYRGAAPIVQDLMGGQIDLAFVPLAGNMQSVIEGGKVKAVTMATPARNANLPNVPSASESKQVKNFNYTVWPAVFVNVKTPEAVVAKLYTHISAIVNGSDYQKWSRETGNQVLQPMSLTQTSAFYRNERERLEKLARSTNLVPQ